MKMIYKNKGKIISCLICSVLAVCLISINVQADNTKFSETCTLSTANSKYQISYDLDDSGNNTMKITLKAADGELKISAIEEGIYTEIYEEVILKNNEKKYIDKSTFQPLNDGVSYVVTDVSSLIGKKIIGATNGKGQSQTLELSEYLGNDNRYVRVSLTIDKTDEICQSMEDATNDTSGNGGTVVLYSYIPLGSLNGVVRDVANTQYNSNVCRAIRGETTYPSDDYSKYYNKSYESSYRTILSYCFNRSVSGNYSDSQLENMLKSALISAYYINFKGTPTINKSFNDAFNDAYNKAVAAKHNYDGEAIPKLDTLKCDYEKISKSRDDNGNYNYVNKDYYYATHTYTTPVEYVYNYEGQAPVKVSQPLCSKTCEETVVVEYGPPQAVVAGMCFEYQVKTTSRVKCKTDIVGGPPTPQSYCTPSPYCVHPNGWEFTQAGPNTDYEICINECDGGKYTQNCSNSCYNKVYVKKSNTKKMSTPNEMLAATNMRNIESLKSTDYYTRENGTIVWRGGGYNRWYQLFDNRSYANFFPSAGFKIKNYGTYICNAVCSNVGCGDNTYLNEETASSDYQENLGRYEQAIQNCSAAATCTTKTEKSIYTIQADYYRKDNNGNVVKVPVRFKDNNELSPYKHNNLDTNSKNYLTPIISYDGCYGNNATDYYQVEWSFPGTWVNNKTGEISFSPIDKNTWHQVKKKFCLPLDAQDINKDWWKYYYAYKAENDTILSGSSGETGSYTSSEYQNTCSNSSLGASDYLKKINSNKIDWNIHATAEKFGYYLWNINIDCFYASSSDGFASDLGTETSKTNATSCNTNLNYETRTVKNEELFPSKDEKTTTDKSTTGRTPGFNWTDAATIPINKSTNYAVRPEKLIEKIQSRGEEIYDEKNEKEYLDYSFYLSPSTLKAIKEDNKKNGSYTKWNGTTQDQSKNNGMTIYESNLFRGSGAILKSGDAVKKLGRLGVNNQSASGAEDNYSYE